MGKTKTRFSLRSVVSVLGFSVFFLVVFFFSFKYFEKKLEEDVSALNSEYFPIVAIQPERVEIIKLNQIENFKKEFPSTSFLVAEGRELLVNQQLKEFLQNQNGKGIPSIKTTQIAEGKQLIEFEISKDGLFRSRYEATEKTVRPLTFVSAGSGFVFFPLITSFAICLIGFLLWRGILLIVKFNKKQNNFYP